METKITREALKAMEPHTIFKSGFYFGGRWVAVRGGIDDWAIYWSERLDGDFPLDDAIAKHGDKVLDAWAIRGLVPCDNEAFKRYRY